MTRRGRKRLAATAAVVAGAIAALTGFDLVVDAFGAIGDRIERVRGRRA